MKPLSLAVVGHTNTGKTSLMRTLLRDDGFGEVSNAAATTKHVECATVGNGSEEWLHLYDTPGLEDAGGVLDWLEGQTSNRRDGVERITAFLDSDAAKQEFSQEAKVLRQIVHSDAALYVIDAREPVLPKYRDELTVLSWCAKPVMPVFNFTADADLSPWQHMLVRRSLHVFSSFDTVAFDFSGEMQFWDNLGVMLPERTQTDKLAQHRREEWLASDRQARQLIAGFLLDAAAYKVAYESAEQVPQIRAAMQDKVRAAERDMQGQLLELYRFYRSSIDSSELPAGAFSHDLFDTDLLKAYGIRTGKGAATGALIGFGVDAVTLGFSMGIGTAVGGLIGGLVPNWQTLSDKINGKEYLYIDAPTLTLLAARSVELLAALQKRGHAAVRNVVLPEKQQILPWQPDRLPESLKKARLEEKWSRLNGFASAAQQRIPEQNELAALLPSFTG